ncbi:GA-binding subunit beta-1 isoform X2 [Paramuricea clavata]|uniref:GA-binding subunit beta-1 isoform X2 n=1 Tax=Paramuricea clavata TaxID=317549 RepID=A0A6S7KDB0_PARCT|nr:GA-binding subunit beta-1 isoform X2 [Paramuricea clavata]
MEKQIMSNEKELDGFTTDNVSSSDSESDNSEDGETRVPKSVKTKTPQQQKDEKFAELCNRITKQVREFAHSDFSIDNLVQRLTNEIRVINSTRDRYDRTIFHYAVEVKNYVLAKILLTVGTNPNCKEGCGATPLSIAVMNADINMCKLLLENFAEYSGPIFGVFPSPIEMAAAMELTDIVDLFNEYSKVNENPLMSVLQSDNCYSTPTQSTNDPAESFDCEKSSQTATDFVYKRSVYQGFPTGIVGDVGTCKINRSVKNRNSTAYGWSTKIPGDMHAKGHLCEATFKAHGKEAVRDGSCAYGISAVHEFRASNEFPSEDDLKTNLRRYGNHNKILLERFKLWLKWCRACDKSHKYHQQFCVFGPLLDLFITAGKEGDGLLRETSWVLLLPIFAQLGFRNYWTEAFVHVVNFTSLWPLAFRCMVKKNSTVNLSGKRGHNVDMDEYVESYVVRPLKTYSTGHTSVQMCKRLMGNLNLLGSVRSIYSQPNSFNYHQTTKHKTQSALPNVIKGMWFCIRNKLLQDQLVSQGNIPLELPL